MTAYEKLKLEYDGIDTLIRDYTDDCRVINSLNQLKKAIECKDKENILYCLNILNNWYYCSMDVIKNDSYYSDRRKDEHEKYSNIILEITKEIENEDLSTLKKHGESFTNVGNPIIFLSHCSDDKKYGDALCEYITNLGVPNQSLIYTSHPLHKVPLDQRIYDYLRDNISGNVFVIILWSNAYLESPACLNEMGAAWVAKKDYTNVYVPTFDFGNPKYHKCAVDTSKMGAVLNGSDNCKANMLELKDKIEKLFGLNNNEQKSQYLLDKFIKEIT